MPMVLIVDDEPRITRLVEEYFDQAGFAVATAHDGPTALAAFDRHEPDAVVLDLGLPHLDGLDVLRALRTKSDVPIVLLTARSEETDRVVGLELGADDYVVKPFGPKELVARVRAILRRVSMTPDVEVVRVGAVRLDSSKRMVWVDDRTVGLTASEFDLLSTLIRQPGRVFTRGQLLDSLHGVSFEPYERAIDAHIKNIRRKIEPDARSPSFVLTVHGVGYKFVDE